MHPDQIWLVFAAIRLDCVVLNLTALVCRDKPVAIGVPGMIDDAADVLSVVLPWGVTRTKRRIGLHNRDVDGSGNTNGAAEISGLGGDCEFTDWSVPPLQPKVCASARSIGWADALTVGKKFNGGQLALEVIVSRRIDGHVCVEYYVGARGECRTLNRGNNRD